MNILETRWKAGAIPGWAAWILAVSLAHPGAPAPALAQEPPAAEAAGAGLAALLAEAEANNPEVLAARKALEAARARVPRAGALPDPTVGVGLMYLPVSTLSNGTEGMTMTSVGVSEMLPFPGKLAVREEAARLLADAAAWDVERVRQKVASEVKGAYYELYLIDRAFEITDRNELLLADFARLTSAKYGVGHGTQADVLKAQVERTRLEEELVSLRQRREAVAARLNALLGRSTGAPLPAPAIPERLLRVAVAPSRPGELSFASASALVGADVAPGGAGPIPAVEELQRLALDHNPMIRGHAQRIAAQRKQLELAGKATLPDFHVSLGYAQRSGGFSDLVSAMVSLPVPIFAGRKQNQAVLEEAATLADMEAQHAAMVNEVNAEIASLVADLRRTRGQLVLLAQGILPHARATLASATAAYRVGRVDFLALLDSQVTLYRYDLDFQRLLSEFARGLAALERAVGKEVLP